MIRISGADCYLFSLACSSSLMLEVFSVRVLRFSEASKDTDWLAMMRFILSCCAFNRKDEDGMEISDKDIVRQRNAQRCIECKESKNSCFYLSRRLSTFT